MCIRDSPEEIETIKKGGCVKKSSCLAKLSPVLICGVLRVGGRLSRAPLPDKSRHQIIISKDSPLGALLIRFFHEKSGHSGKEYVLALLRERFWLIRANTTARSVLSSCFQCKHRHGPAGEQKMADLPRSRVTPDQPPFTCVGIDYFGPFLVRQKRSLVKRYGAIFTCLALRAVHLEISHTLDTDSFILALRRFIARRGQVKEIRSDNGTNFTGAEKELRAMISRWNQAKIHDTLLQKGIKWVFNPPGASHHGGVWERLIRSTRKILGALTKEQVLDDECLQTLLCEAESIINGRPLTKFSDNPNDLEPIMPNHLRLLRQNDSLPPGLFEKNNTYSGRRWRQVQYLACSGVNGNENTFLHCRSARNGFDREETSLLETRLSLMNRRPGMCGRLVESQKCSQIKMRESQNQDLYFGVTHYEAMFAGIN